MTPYVIGILVGLAATGLVALLLELAHYRRLWPVRGLLREEWSYAKILRAFKDPVGRAAFEHCMGRLTEVEARLTSLENARADLYRRLTEADQMAEERRTAERLAKVLTDSSPAREGREG